MDQGNVTLCDLPLYGPESDPKRFYPLLGVITLPLRSKEFGQVRGPVFALLSGVSNLTGIDPVRSTIAASDIQPVKIKMAKV